MKEQTLIDYQRIELAIDYIVQNFRAQPSLEEIAAVVHTSPHHFQRLFSQWAGVSPKKFQQYLSLRYAKRSLIEHDTSLLAVAHDVGLSGTSRLHDLFVNIERMTPGEFKQGGRGLVIQYSFAESPFGALIIASTARGVCHLTFEADEATGLARLQARFPEAHFAHFADESHLAAVRLIHRAGVARDPINLHLLGSPFQIKVWEALLKIPQGALATYGKIADEIGQPKTSRAVGTAIGANPIAFLIPCHRVIRKNGEIGGYRWGEKRKRSIIAWEAARSQAFREES